MVQWDEDCQVRQGGRLRYGSDPKKAGWTCVVNGMKVWKIINVYYIGML